MDFYSQESGRFEWLWLSVRAELTPEVWELINVL